VSEIYLYKLTTDNGGAPCITGRKLLSLAICKPIIRINASVDDLIFGFAAKSLSQDNRLIYVARVTEVILDGRYYIDKRYIGRGDRIYKFRKGKFEWRQGSKHHGPTDLVHDLGLFPEYERACVLLSSEFRYFGKTETDEYKSRFPRVGYAIKNLGSGHRVRHDPLLRRQLLAMANWVFQSTERKILGPPTSSSSRGVCHREGSDVWRVC
jgi:hypothetical protein